MYEEFKERLESTISTGIIENELMNRHTTFKVGGPCSVFISPKKNEIPKAIKLCQEYDVPYIILGRGSNVLFSDKGYDGVVIEMGEANNDITVDDTVITAGAGATLAAVAMKAYENGLAGFEFASGIPGSIGGGLYMNAGAYGGEMKDVVVSAEAMDINGNLITVECEDMDLSYRHSTFMVRDLIVMSVTIRLNKGDKAEIKALMDDFNGRRRDKQPLNYPSAGSFFKRPEGNYAGKLIEDAGLAGLRVGGAAVSSKHCGFIINVDNATSDDIIELMKKVQNEVKKQFGVDLEPEVKFVGSF
ncbi:MAG: UDP-N-acetylmuramate dehydrogenase [Lachnospiraceae bacterium]|nr:UDP-N-acetylmuramate dehydrogenase [Lachnospiraceae bacterium]